MRELYLSYIVGRFHALTSMYVLSSLYESLNIFCCTSNITRGLTGRHHVYSFIRCDQLGPRLLYSIASIYRHVRRTMFVTCKVISPGCIGSLLRECIQRGLWMASHCYRQHARIRHTQSFNDIDAEIRADNLPHRRRVCGMFVRYSSIPDARVNFCVCGPEAQRRGPWRSCLAVHE